MSFTFDGPNKRIICGPGTTTLAVRDMWSRYCDWLAESDNSKYGEALRQVGGDVIQIPIYLFVLNGWRIVPQAADHTLTVTDGVLYEEFGGDPFVDPAGAYKIRIKLQAPGIAIGYDSGGGGGGSTVDPSDIAAAVRSSLSVELSRIDAPVSSRVTAAEVSAALAVLQAALGAQIGSPMQQGATVLADLRYVRGQPIVGDGSDDTPWGPG